MIYYHIHIHLKSIKILQDTIYMKFEHFTILSVRLW